MSDINGLFARQPQGGIARLFGWQDCFVDLRRVNLERQSKAFKEFTSIARSRGEYDQGTDHAISLEPPIAAPQAFSMSSHIPTIDSFELARSGRQIAGEVAISRLPRLAEFLSAADGVLQYRVNGLINDDGSPGAGLRLTGALRLTCQRCNKPLDLVLDRTVRFRFVGSEKELNSLPLEDDEIDAVVGSRTMSLHDWVEDEAILSLPLVPRHAECAAPLSSGDTVAPAVTPNPFAVLAALRGRASNDEGQS